jgi:hypothetical protein
MTPDKREMESAKQMRDMAMFEAWSNHPLGSDDVAAATAAILCRALELATPELSPQGRARLFLGEE